MISEALENSVEDGRVSHGLWLCVISHGYGGWGGNGGGQWYACGTKPEGLVGCLSEDAGALPDVCGDTLMTPDHTAYQVHSSG